MNLLEKIKDRPLYLDGAMGTMLQKAGLEAGSLPEEMNITHPEVLTGIHRAYLEAGSDIVTANTFQAGELKTHGSKYSVEELVGAGIKNARAAGAPLVALDLGPLGQLMQPMGEISFERACDIYRRQVVAAREAGADMAIIETIFDLYEARAAVLAVRENSDMPILCSLTYQADGRTFVGCDPLSAAVTLSGLGVDAVGVNCSLGPKELMPVVDTLLAYSRVPVFVQANAGLPEVVDGNTVYNIGPEEFAAAVAPMVEKGVRIVGGCCGTDPDFIRALRAVTEGIPYVEPQRQRVTAACSGRNTVIFDGCFTVIGERINPTGRDDLAEALREDDLDTLLDEAIDQADEECGLLDINVGLGGIDEADILPRVVQAIQGAVALPLVLDSASPEALAAAARVCNGKPVINSVSGKAESLEKVLPVAKKYGGLLVGLTMDDEGIPATAEGRVEIARRIVTAAEAAGIPWEDILIDCLTLPESSQPEGAGVTLAALRMVKAELGVKTVLGISNISHGAPERNKRNAAFLRAALEAGLDAAILDPMSKENQVVIESAGV